MPVASSTSGRINEEFLLLLYLHVNREGSPFMVTIPLDLSTRSFIPLPRFVRTRTTTPLLTPSIVLLNQSSA